LNSYENESEEALIPSDDLESTEGQLEEAESPLAGTMVPTAMDGVDAPEEELQARKKRGWRFFSFTSLTRAQLWTIIAFGGVVLLGAVLRFWDLGAKPLHWDESLHAYFSMQLLHNNIENWAGCLNLPFDRGGGCYHYDPLLHGPFQFHAIALVYLVSGFLGVVDHGINPTTVRIAAALLGTVIVGMPYFLRQYLGKIGAWLACFLLAVSPSMVYFSRFAREDIYMACFTLVLIVSVVQYVRTRKMSWVILAALSFVLSYATKEATFLSIAVFGSFAGALLVWEVASRRLWNVQQAPLPVVEAGTNGTPVQETPVLESGVVVYEPVTAMEVDVAQPQAGVFEGVDAVQIQSLPPTQRPVRMFSFLESIPPRTFRLLALLAYFVAIGIPAVLIMNWTKSVSIYANASPANMKAAQNVVNNLKNATLEVVPWLGILLAIGIFLLLLREQSTENEPKQRRGLARWVDPQRQRFLDTIVTMPWMHWFFALVVGWTVFLLLFTALFTYMPGIGDAVWQGIFYWITQQTVARGGQPWYYYFMLIPLYEQIGVIFGVVGIVNCLVHPTRFRLFLVYWFVGNFFIYSWAGEKMPWLVIHMTMPLMLLAALGLRPIVEHLIRLAKDVSAWLKMRREKSAQTDMTVAREQDDAPIPLFTPGVMIGYAAKRVLAVILIAVMSYAILGIWGSVLIAILGGVLIDKGLLVLSKASRKVRGFWSTGETLCAGILALLALILTLQNMYQLTYPHPADAKSELLIYVQTTPYVNTIMDKVAQLDRKYCGGRQEISIGVAAEATWPFSWYLRDYKHVGYNYTPASLNPPNTLSPSKAPNCKDDFSVVITAGSTSSTMYAQNPPGQVSSQYKYHEYEMRAQGNQGYMPPLCVPTGGHACESQQYTGVGLGTWLSWGANPPSGVSFDPGRAMMRIWQWWWERIPIGRGVPSRGDLYAADDPGAMMALFIRKDLGVDP
jgi:uncharacterized protein (TIGR03663 family)